MIGSEIPLKRPFLRAEWRWLAMLNYEVPPEILEPWLPHGVELDPWQGRTLVSLVGFRFLDTRVMGMAIPAREPVSALLAEGSAVTVYQGGRLP